jgi:hypothetical protein
MSFFQVKRLENEMNPLKQNVKNLTAQKDMLVGEKTGLKSEVRLTHCFVLDVVVTNTFYVLM